MSPPSARTLAETESKRYSDQGRIYHYHHRLETSLVRTGLFARSQPARQAGWLYAKIANERTYV